MPLGQTFYVLTLLNFGLVAPQWFPLPQPPEISAPLYRPGFGIQSYDQVDWIYPLPDFTSARSPRSPQKVTPDHAQDNLPNWWVSQGTEDSFFTHSAFSK